jgi:hypothetical protein
MSIHPKLEEVYKTSGLPTYTFVEPRKYPDLLLSLRTPGRCLVVEGPSGIGKSTAIEKALEKVGLSKQVTKLSARNPADVEYIKLLPETKAVGTVLIDDFHRLDEGTKARLADYLKVLADTEEQGTKIVVLGINRAGDSLIHFSPDLVNRVDIVRFETEPDEKISQLVMQGEKALNISLGVIDEIIESVRGSFYLAQMLSKEICLTAGILAGDDAHNTITVSFESVKANVWDRLGAVFQKRCEEFCRGSKLRKEGRAPYLHILYWLATGETWTLDLRAAIRRNAELRGSVGQVVDKGFLKDIVTSHADIRQVMHFDENSELLTIEDPQFLFYIRNISWRLFARKIGFMTIDFDRRYDFALSFAGTDRDAAEALFLKLTENEVEVFYDKNEQHRILAQDVEEYLRPIYQTEAQFVIVLLGREYPKRIWTKIESDAFKERFIDGSVIPIWFADVDPSMFDRTRETGGITLDRSKDMAQQIDQTTNILIAKLGDSRQ